MARGSVTDWVAEHIDPNTGVEIIDRTAEDFLMVRYKKGAAFPAAVIGAQDVVLPDDVAPVLAHATKPNFVVNVPSKAVWSGPAIAMVHGTPAGFGVLGDLMRAARDGDAAHYRNKEFGFFERAIKQHSNVRGVTREYDAVFIAHRYRGNDLVIALVDAYNMSAEDIRRTRDRYGAFDIAVKMSSYGSVTSAATAAADSMGAGALMFREMLRRLAQ